MVICDTNILSTFARVGALDLLFRLFPQHQFALPQAVHDEIKEAIRIGSKFIDSVSALIASGQILIITLTSEEQQKLMNLPSSFGAGESEAVALCARGESIFLSNDKSVKNYCRNHGVEIYDLPRLLRALWENKVVSRQKVQKLVSDMERTEGIVFKNKERIFKKTQRS